MDERYSHKILDGRLVAKSMEAEISARIAEETASGKNAPVLATVIVGENPASVTYVRMKGNACRRVGIEPRKVALKEETTTEELLAVIDELNADPDVYGILLQHPVPRQIDERKCFDRIAPEKDVDGILQDPACRERSCGHRQISHSRQTRGDAFTECELYGNGVPYQNRGYRRSRKTCGHCGGGVRRSRIRASRMGKERRRGDRRGI